MSISLKSICSFVLLSSLAQAVPIEFRMDFRVQETGFEHPVGTTAFVSAIYDSDPPRIPPELESSLLESDTSDWFQGESLTVGVGDEVFMTPVKPSINVWNTLLRYEDISGETIIFVVAGRSGDEVLPDGRLPTSESDLDLSHNDFFYEAIASFAPMARVINKERGFELVDVSIGPVPEPSGSLLLVFGAIGFLALRRRLQLTRRRQPVFGP